MIHIVMKKVVVDRARLPYSSGSNALGVANLSSGLTQFCALPKLLANLNGPMGDGNPTIEPDHNAIGARHG